ncbi:MAG: Cna B-type domain-containing protein [Mogibacterium sp.]|nr:Cna B-type domain-containing protein [Mogibacterium sp.]
MMVNYIPSIAFAAGGNANGSGAQTGVEAPEASKTLTPNSDGTYDLSLSVKGKSSTETETSMADVIIVFDKSTSMANSVGSGKTRMSVAKPAVKNLIDSLLSKNQQTAGAVKVGLVSFGTNAAVDSQLSDNGNSLKNKVQNYNTDAPIGERFNYTNWEDALQKVQAIETRSGAKKYVIFVSDGNPTVYIGGGAKNETESNVNNCFNHAKDDAQALANKGYKFYGVGAFGSATRMQNLVKEAGGTGVLNNDYFDASDEAALIAAFANIIESITTTIDYENVKITDGVTGLTSMMEVNGEPGNFTYTKNGETWSDAPAARFDEGKRSVTWDLSSIGALDNGVTYTVHFTVWPSQRAYDITAAMANGDIAYGDTKAKLADGTTVSAEEWDQFTEAGALKTNTNASVDYKAYKIVNDDREIIGEGPAPIKNPDPVPLTSAKMIVQKVWNDSFSSGDRPDSVELVVLQDGKEFKTVTLTGSKDENTWTQEINIAPGIAATIDEKQGAKGYKYTVTEPDIENHYELTTETIQPMVYDNEQRLEDILTDPYKQWEDGKAVVTATNTVKGGINIYKTVTYANEDEAKDDTDTTKFEFTITLTKDGKPVATPASSMSGDLGYRIYEGETEKGRGSVPEDGKLVLSITKDQYIRIVNVPKGTEYKVVESDADGYVLKSPEDPAEGTVLGNDKHDVTFKNEKQFEDDKVSPVLININKTDAQTGEVLPISDDYPAAVFSVNKDGKKYGDTKVADGKIAYLFTEAGEYTFKETSAPTGYQLNGETFTVKVTKEYVSTDYDEKSGKWIKSYILKTDKADNTFTVPDDPKPVDVSGEKTWNDEEWTDLKGYERPETIKINLLANGIKIKEKIVKADEETGKWNYEFKDLPEYRDGKKVTYSVTEEVVGYTVDKPEEGGEYDLENTPNADLDEDVTGKLSLFVEKVDAATKQRINGAEFKVERLDEDGKPIGDSGTAKGNADYVFKDAGTYRFTEITPPGGYETCGSVFVVNVEKVFNHTERNDEGIWVKYYDLKVASITESGKPASGISFEDPSTLTSVSAEKVWEDNDDQDGLRDDAVIEFTLYDGETVASVKDAVVTVDKDDNWSYTWNDLPAYRDGEKIEYSVKETKVPDGYTSSTADANAVPDENGKAVITNTHTPGEVSVNGAKTWADDNNKYKNRPEQIVINLTGTIEGKSEPVVTQSATVTAKEGWAWSFTGLPEKLEKKTVKYKVTEEPVATYKTSYSEEDYDVTNTPETVDVEGSKTWNDDDDKYDNRPESIKITLLANGEQFENNVVEVTEKDNWSWSFKGLPKYIGGEEVTYSVVEDKVATYLDPTYEGYNVTNTPETVEVNGTKTWNDEEWKDLEGYKRPDSITVTLLANGEAFEGKSVEVKADENDEWNYEFKVLPKYINGEEVKYTVEETVTGFSPEYSKTGYDIDNTPNADLDEDQVTPLELEIVKTDENTGNPLDGAEFEVSQLSKETGEYIEPQTVAGNDVFSFKDEGTYRIVETVAPEGYELDTTEYKVVISRVFVRTDLDTDKNIWVKYYDLQFDSVDGEFNADEASLTVADTPTTVDITAKKIWDDSKNKDGKRKDIEFTLYADGKKVDGSAQTLGTRDGETCTWTDMPAYKDGKKVEYSVKETKVPDKYVSSTEFKKAKVDKKGNATITNTYSGNPKTGDDNNLLVNLFGLIGSLMAGTGLLIGRKRRKA